MTVVGEQPFTPGDEIDELRWVLIDDLPSVLSYARDVDVVNSVGGRRVTGW
jgi:hypothetical protein